MGDVAGRGTTLPRHRPRHAQTPRVWPIWRVGRVGGTNRAKKSCSKVPRCGERVGEGPRRRDNRNFLVYLANPANLAKRAKNGRMSGRSAWQGSHPSVRLTPTNPARPFAPLAGRTRVVPDAGRGRAPAGGSPWAAQLLHTAQHSVLPPRPTPTRSPPPSRRRHSVWPRNRISCTPMRPYVTNVLKILAILSSNTYIPSVG
jgi:hypothetical protein